MAPKLFTKSAFKQALACPASLYYYRNSDIYANQNNEDDFLAALADGGMQAGDLGKVYYDIQPDADINTLNQDVALDLTGKLLHRDNVNIAEAAFRWGNCFVRADIIEKKGREINLIEVKAKSWEEKPGEDKNNRFKSKGGVEKTFLPYVYDVAFQKYVIQNALGPEYVVRAHLMLADKTVVCDAPDGVNQFFRVNKVNGRTVIDRAPGAGSLRGCSHVLRAIDVDNLCADIIEGRTSEQLAVMGCTFKQFVDTMSEYCVKGDKIPSLIGDKCFKCPFFSNEKTPGKKDGRVECWKENANFTDEDFKKPSVSELWCGLTGPRSLKKELVEKGKYHMENLCERDIPLSNCSGPGLSPSGRRILQIALTNADARMLAPFAKNIHDGVYVDVDGLRTEMAGWKYPLHMIDFETTSVALPFYKGMRPYEQVAFQFSHHVIERDGSVRHAGQWLNTAKHNFPNFEFVRELKKQLSKDTGSIFRYATHENSILRAIHAQLKESGEPDKDELMSFIDSITHYKDGRTIYEGPRDMIDLLEMVRRYYYHPSMKGSNSIKVVLPAVLRSSKALQAKYSHPIYGSKIFSCNIDAAHAKSWITKSPDGTIDNPYKHLDEIASFLDVTCERAEEYDTQTQMNAEGTVNNGGIALAAYTKLQFSGEAMTAALKEALLRYCELDTMSMVFIWEYFHEMTNK